MRHFLKCQTASIINCYWNIDQENTKDHCTELRSFKNQWMTSLYSEDKNCKIPKKDTWYLKSNWRHFNLHHDFWKSRPWEINCLKFVEMNYISENESSFYCKITLKSFTKEWITWILSKCSQSKNSTTSFSPNVIAYFVFLVASLWVLILLCINWIDKAMHFSMTTLVEFFEAQ